MLEKLRYGVIDVILFTVTFVCSFGVVMHFTGYTPGVMNVTFSHGGASANNKDNVSSMDNEDNVHDVINVIP